METKQRLLDSALEIMSEKPFSSVSMSDIAERVGLSKGAVYWHFKNKNDVLIKLIETICNKGTDDFFQDGSFEDGMEGIRHFFHKKLEAGTCEGHVLKVNKLVNRMHEWPEEVLRCVFDSVNATTKREMEIISEIVKQAQDTNKIRGDIPPGDIAGIMFAILFGMIHFHVHGLNRIDVTKYSDVIFSALEKEFACDNNIVPIQGEKIQCEAKC